MEEPSEEIVPIAPAAGCLAEDLRRVAWALPRVALFDEDAVLVLRRDADFATRGLFVLVLGLPFAFCQFLNTEAALALLTRPGPTLAAFLLFFLVGSLSLGVFAFGNALAFGRREVAPAVMGACLWWGFPVLVLSSAWSAWQPWLRLTPAGALGVDVLLTGYTAVASAWVVARVSGLPVWVTLWFVLWDLGLSGVLWTAIFS